MNIPDSRTLLIRVAKGAALSALCVACAVNPVTGERELALISESQEIAMGREAAAQVRSTMQLVEDNGLQQYVSRIGQELARTSERPDLPWEFHVVDDPVPNAFALPGGFIFVTRGLMALMSSEAELAAVLGHEIGHVTARHSVNQLSRAQLAQIGLGIGVVAAPDTVGEFQELAGSGLSLLFLKYGRDDERQADELGFGYMRQHQYDVREMANVFASLQASSALAGASPLPGWLASHPDSPERIDSAQQRVAALGPQAQFGRVASDEYMQHIDGLVYGPDPRNGYFESTTFYHPQLRFSFEIPQGWDRKNLSSAVIGTSPNGDAAMQLMIAEGELQQAAMQFLESQGIADLGSSQTRVNGRSAIITEFSAPGGNQGDIRGVAAHIEMDGRIYRLVAYTQASAYDSYMDTFGEIIGSFERPSNEDVFEVDPQRVRVVTLDTDMTLSDFASRYPSDVPLAELAVLNQVEGSSARLSAGSLAKQVTG